MITTLTLLTNDSTLSNVEYKSELLLTSNVTKLNTTQPKIILENIGVTAGPIGVGIATVIRTSGDGSFGSLDVYTITFTNGTTSTFEVQNGLEAINVINDTVTAIDLTYSSTNIESKLLDKANTSQVLTDVPVGAVFTDTVYDDTQLQSDVTAHTGSLLNPHAVTQVQVGLPDVDNTSDINKPVSIAAQTALDLKVDNLDFVNHAHVEADITDLDKYTRLEVDGKDGVIQGTVDNHILNIINPHNVTKTQIGLSNVDNTSDSAKPVSLSTQTALDGKVDDSQVLTNVPAGAVFTDTQTIVTDTLLSISATDALSANQGRVLKGLVDSINTLLLSDDIALDELQEIVNYIKANKTILDTLAISNIAGLQVALDAKVDDTQVLTNVPVNAVFTDTQVPVIDTLVSLSGTDALSAGQGTILKGLIDIINVTLASNDIALNTVQEIVDYVKANNAAIAALDILDISGLQPALDGKVDDAQVLTNVPINALFTDTVYSDTAIQAAVTLNTAKITYPASDSSKLAGIEAGATIDQTGAEIKAAYEFELNTNAFTDVEKAKLLGIDIGANDYTHPATHAIAEVSGLQTALDGKVDDLQVLTNVPIGALFTDTVYDDTALQAEVTINTAKVSNVDHPVVATAVPLAAVFTDTVYNDTVIQAAVALNTAKVSNVDHPTVLTAVPVGAVFTDTETVTSLTLVGNNLTYTDENGTPAVHDLSLYLDDTNLARLVSGVYNGTTQQLVFTRDDASTFTIDASMFFDDTNLVTSVAGRSGAVVITKADVGLGSVDNTSDLAKPISTATQTALTGKVDDSQVLTNVPLGAVFTDTVYSDTALQALVALNTAKITYPATASTKLAGIESDATGDQTGAEIKALYELELNTNAFTDAEKAHLAAVEPLANNYIHPAAHAISVITGLQAALDGKVDDGQVLTNVPAGAVFTDTLTVLNDTLISISITEALTANQGKVLKGLIDSINTVLVSDDLTLNTLQEVVTFIKLNRTDIDSLGIINIAGLQVALDSKVDDAQVLTNVPAGAVFTDTLAVYNDTLTSIATNEALTANQGKVLKGLIDNINTLLLSDDVTLDELQEVVDFIKLNKTALDNLAIVNIAGLTAALDAKVDDTQVLTNVPAGALFTDTDTIYDDTVISAAVALNTAKITYPVTASDKLAGIEVGATADQFASEVLMSNTIGTPLYAANIEEQNSLVNSSGIVAGGDLTDNLNGTISIASATAFLRTTGDPLSTLHVVTVPAYPNMVFVDGIMNYVYAKWNGGIITYGTTIVQEEINCQDQCLAYLIHRNGNVLHVIDDRQHSIDVSKKVRAVFRSFSYFIRSGDGAILSEASPLAIAVTASVFYYTVTKLTHNAYDTSIIGTANENVFTLHYRDGVGGWLEEADQKLIDTTLYDDGSGIPLTILGNNNFGVSWVYLVHGQVSGDLHVVMGQAEYATLSDAENAALPVEVPTLIAGLASLIGFVVYEKGTTTFTNVLSAFTQSFNSATATTHNGLAGLQGGDGSEYYHVTAAQITEFNGFSAELDGKVDDAQVLTDVPTGALFTDTVYDDTVLQAEVTLNTAKVSNIAHPLVETAVPIGAVFTDTVYDDTTISAAVALNTAKVTNVDHPLIETAVPLGAVFTDTVFDDTAITAAVALNTAKVSNVDHPIVSTAVPVGAVFTDTVYTHPLSHTIAEITGLQAGLDGKVDDGQVLTDVPAGAVFTDTETVTSLTLVGNSLTYTDESGTPVVHDLSLYLDDTNLSKIISGVYVTDEPIVGDKSLKFTRDDLSVFYIDASMFFDDTNLVLSVAGRSGTVVLTKADVGLSNVDNTNDLAKPVSTATQTSLDGKIDDSQVLTNVPAGALFTDTVYTHPSTDGSLHVPANGTTNAGDILTASALAGVYTWEPAPDGVTDHTLLSNIGTNTHAQIDTHINSTLNPHGVTAAQVGLGNVDNTSDAAKPISSATQTALNAKVDDGQVLTNVPLGALFTDTDTIYDDSSVLKDTDTLTPVTALNKLVTEADVSGGGDMLKATYDTLNNGIVDNAELVNGLTVATAVPAGAVFTDTVYSHPATHSIAEVSGLQTALDAKVDDTQVLTNVPIGAVFTDTVYNDTAIAAAVAINTAKVSNVDHPLVQTAVPLGAVFTDTETVTSLTLVGNVLTYTNESGTPVNHDLSLYLDDTNLARLVSGVYNAPTQELIFTRSDASTFAIDASMFFDDTNLVTSVAGRSGAVTLTKADVGLSNVDNTSDLAKPISTATQTALNGKIDDSQVLTNVPAGAVFTDTTYTVQDGELSEVNFTSADNTKLDGISPNANFYELPNTVVHDNTSYTAGHHSEGRLLRSAALTNDFANATKRGSALNFTNATTTDAENMFDGLSTFKYIDASTATFPIVLEFTVPKTLLYGSGVGIGFGNATWRCKGVKIEAFSEGAWVTCIDLVDNASEDVFTTIPGNAGTGTTSMRYTLTDPNTTSMRIAHLWGYDYASDLWSQLQMPRAGGTMYGSLNTQGDITLDGTVDGRDVASDGVKLDGIESNATADQTKTDIDALGIDAATVNAKTVLTSVPAGAVFTDTVYDDTTISAAVALNTAKVSNVAHPIVETAVPVGAVFTDTVYDDTTVIAAVALNTTHSGSVHAPTDAEANDANTTLQGNVFNGISQLVQTNASGELPALSAVNLTNLPASGTTLHAELTDLGTSGHDADIIGFSNIASGLTATDVQSAIDEIADIPVGSSSLPMFVARSTMTSQIANLNADVTWNTEIKKSTDFTHLADSATFTVNFSGAILIMTNVGVNASLNRIQLDTFVYKNSVQEAASRSSQYATRDINQESGNVVGHYYMTVADGDDIKVNLATASDGTSALIDPTQTRLTVMRIDTLAGADGIQGPEGPAGEAPIVIKSEIVATTDQSLFTVSYTVDHVDVFIEGTLLDPGQYTATNGTSITLTVPVDLGTWVRVVSGDNVPSDFFTQSGGTITGDLTVNGTFTATAIDAVTLDGVDAIQFLRSDQDTTTTGLLTAAGFYCSGTGNANGLIIENGKHQINSNDGGGNFNIRVGNDYATGCTEAGYVSHWAYSQSSGAWTFSGSTASELVDASPTWQTNLTIDSSGSLTALGNVTAYSDRRVKKNIEVIPDAMSKIAQLSGYTFDRTDTNTARQTGVIAQEVQEVLPEAVMETEDGRLSVAYGNMVGLLIEGMKEQQLTINGLESRIAELENI